MGRKMGREGVLRWQIHLQHLLYPQAKVRG
jgi:hypothetical protein